MVTFIPYTADHLAKIELQPAQQQWAEKFFEPGYAASLDVPDMAWTGVSDDGRVIGCAGFAPQWQGRVIAWAVFGRVPKKAWPRIVAKARKEIERRLGVQKKTAGHARVEVTVPVGFANGCRLANALQFKIEGISQKYGPDGVDHYSYAMVA